MADEDPAKPVQPQPAATDTDVPDINALAADDDTAPVPTPPSAAASVSDFELDRTRKQLAYRLLWILIGIIAIIMLMSVIYSVRCWTTNKTCGDATQALGILTGAASPIFTAMVGLVGSVVGFYFGSKSSVRS